MGVSREIAQHLLGAAERGFDVSYPVFVPQRFDPFFKAGRVAKVAKRSVEAEFTLDEGLLEIVEELAPEQVSEWLYGKKESFLPGRNPALPVGRKSPGGHDAVEVGMVFQSLVPRVQNSKKAQPGAQPLRHLDHPV